MDVAHDIAKHFDLPMERIVHVRDRAFNDQRCAANPPAPPALYCPDVCPSQAKIGNQHAGRRHAHKGDVAASCMNRSGVGT